MATSRPLTALASEHGRTGFLDASVPPRTYRRGSAACLILRSKRQGGLDQRLWRLAAAEGRVMGKREREKGGRLIPSQPVNSGAAWERVFKCV